MHCARASGLLIEKPHARFRVIAGEATGILLYAVVFALIPYGVLMVIMLFA